MKTFVVRLYVPAEPAPSPESALRGVVQEIGSNRPGSFASGSELLAFLAARERDARLPERSTS